MLQKQKFLGYFKFQGHDVIVEQKLEEVENLWSDVTLLTDIATVSVEIFQQSGLLT